MKLIFENWHRYLSEITRYEKETGKKSFGKHDITKYVRDSGLGRAMAPVKYAFTMVDIEKVGLNPRTKFNTPAGVYFYPLNQEYYEKLVKNKLPYASEKPYVGVVRLKDTNTDKWLRFLQRGRNYANVDRVMAAYDKVFPAPLRPQDREDLLAGLQQPSAISDELRHWDFNNDAKIFDLTWYGTKGSLRSTLKWNKLLRDLGYIGIYDNNNSIIHPGEPFQITALSPEAYEVVGFYTTADIRKVDFPINVNKLIQMAEKRGLPESIYWKLARIDAVERYRFGSYSIIRDRLIKNPDTPKEIFEFIFADPARRFADLDPQRGDTAMIQALATSPLTPTKILREIAALSRARRARTPLVHSGGALQAIEVALAYNVASTEDILVLLAPHPNMRLRVGVAKNPKTPTKALGMILGTSRIGDLNNSKLIKAFVNNPNTTKELLKRLIHSMDLDGFTYDGYANLVKSRHMPPELLTILAKAALGEEKEWQDVPWQRMNKIPSWALAVLAVNPVTTSDTLRMLYRESSPVVAKSIARNPNTPVDILEEMLGNSDTALVALSNPKISVEILTRAMVATGPGKPSSYTKSHIWGAIRRRFRNGDIPIEQASRPPFTDKNFRRIVYALTGDNKPLSGPDSKGGTLPDAWGDFFTDPMELVEVETSKGGTLPDAWGDGADESLDDLQENKKSKRLIRIVVGGKRP